VNALYLTDAYPDYLSDDLLYGLRSVLGDSLVDFPRKDVLYRTSPLKSAAHSLYGAGFHCFGLDDLPVDRTDIRTKIMSGYFDVIINSSAWRIHCPPHPQLAVLDGEDHERLTPRYLHKVPLYFKRELGARQRGLEPVLFALPDFLRDDRVLARTKRYHASFRLNNEGRRNLAVTFPQSGSFRTWADYVGDIKQSWFAISPKGGGHDCQRHYEILGNAVLCIYMDAHTPWLLQQYFADNRNCLTFASAAELAEKMHHCTAPQRLIDQAREDLVRCHLASKRAEQLLATIVEHGVLRRRPSWIDKWQWTYWLRRRVSWHARSLLTSAAAGRLAPPRHSTTAPDHR
jgi:hypothetical protein